MTRAFKIIINVDPENDSIGAASKYDPLPGENWTRGNDLQDGKISTALDAVLADCRDLIDAGGDTNVHRGLRMARLKETMGEK